MTCSNGTTSIRLLSATGLAFSALLVLCAVATPALADDHHDRHDDRRGGYEHRGYYNAPPVVYGSPYYAPPPVVYGPGIGIVLPGVAIGVR